MALANRKSVLAVETAVLDALRQHSAVGPDMKTVASAAVALYLTLSAEAREAVLRGYQRGEFSAAYPLLRQQGDVPRPRAQPRGRSSKVPPAT